MITAEPAPSQQDIGATALPARWAHRATGASIVDSVRLRVPGAPVAAYQDNRWPLQAWATNSPRRSSSSSNAAECRSMGWRDVELEWRESLKRVAWLMINQPVPDHLLQPGKKGNGHQECRQHLTMPLVCRRAGS